MNDDGLVGKIGTAVVGLIVVFVLASSWVNIPAGYVGVVFDKSAGGVQPENLKEGWHFRTPIKTYIREYPVSLRTFSNVGTGDGEGAEKESPLVSLPTSGGQHIDQQISIVYHIDPKQANMVFDRFQGQDIEEIESSFIRRNVQSVATAITGSVDLMDALGSKKAEIQGNIQTKLKDKLSPYGFIVDQVNLGYAKPPAAIEQALQAKMQAEQQADQAKYGLQKAEMDARAKIAAAEGEAKANALVRQQLSPEFLKFRALEVQQKTVEKWNGQLPTHMLGGGTVPFLNLNASN